VVTAAVVETQKDRKLKTTLKLHFKFDSMTLVLHSPNENMVCKDKHTYKQNKANTVPLHCPFPLSEIRVAIIGCILHFV